MTIPQIRGMYNTDRSRKSTLVDYGFRLPSSLDNRPLNFEEFNQKIEEGFFAEYQSYNTEFGVWNYGTALDDLENSDDKSVIIMKLNNLII